MTFKIVKKGAMSQRRQTLYRLGAVVAALVATAVVMAVAGYNPFTVYYKMIEGSTMTAYRFKETINKAIPLITLSLGVAVAFKMKFWNIGGEGQFYLGAFGAALVAFKAPNLPMWLMLPAMILCGMLLGGLWALIPAILKGKFGTSETLVTLMLNYIATKWITYLQYGPWKDPKASGFPKMPKFVDAAVLPKVLGVHAGWILTLVAVALVWVLFRRSKLGYEIAVLGESEATARYAGMNTTRTMLIAVLLSGGLCGLAGMMQASAVERSLSDVLSGGMGFTAIITAWLARLNPPAIVGVCFFFAILLQGGSYLQTSMQIPSSVASIIQGVVLFFVLASEFFVQYKIQIHRGGKEVA
jgi:ABC-type uncharacterized transport system permease subunit